MIAPCIYGLFVDAEGNEYCQGEDAVAEKLNCFICGWTETIKLTTPGDINSAPEADCKLAEHVCPPVTVEQHKYDHGLVVKHRDMVLDLRDYAARDLFKLLCQLYSQGKL